MTKPLPQRDVEARPTRAGRPRLTAIEEKLLASIDDENLKKVIGELLISSRGSQENFQTIEQWLPIQPQDFHGVTGLPFRAVVFGEIESGKSKFLRGGEGLTVQRLATGVYRILVEKGYEFSLPADFVNAVPRVAAGTQAVAIDVEPTSVEGVGEGWLVHLFQNVASSTPVDASFYFFAANFVDSEGNTIKGPRGPAGPTHKSLLSGAGAPGEEVGEVDDFYVDLENFVFYGPKTEAGWGEGSSLVGPQGEKGEKGEKGAGATGSAEEDLEGEWPKLLIRKLKVTGEKIANATIDGPKIRLVETALEWWNSGSLREKIRGYNTGSNFMLELVSAIGLEETKLLLEGGGGGKTFNRIVAAVQAQTKTLLDSAGNSNFMQLSSVRKVTDFGRVTALPASPAVGDLCRYVADKTNGIVWSFEYDGEGEFPWKKIGGPPLRNAPGSPATASTVFQSVGAPSIAAPLAGEYDQFMEADVSNGVAELNVVRIGTFVGGVEGGSIALALAASFVAPMSWRNRVTVAKGAAIQVRFKSESAKSATFFGISTEIDPVRVG